MRIPSQHIERTQNIIFQIIIILVISTTIKKSSSLAVLNGMNTSQEMQKILQKNVQFIFVFSSSYFCFTFSLFLFSFVTLLFTQNPKIIRQCFFQINHLPYFFKLYLISCFVAFSKPHKCTRNARHLKFFQNVFNLFSNNFQFIFIFVFRFSASFLV